MTYRQPSLFLSALFVLALSVSAATLPNLLPQSARAQVMNGNVSQSYLSGGQQQQESLENVMILLDSSYSMGEHLESGRNRENKMQVAKRTVLEVLRDIPPNVRVGLRVYGNSSNQFSACRASNVLVPLGQNNRTLISSKLIGVRPTGATPISYSVQHALDEDFRNVAGKKSIILISDGIETCGEDPCNLAVRMQQLGANVKINVVGLGLQDYEAIKQLRCVALATKGKFYTANTAAELANSLTNAMAVETNVQATILLPKSPPSLPPATPKTQATSSSPPHKSYEDQLLPAAVPIQSNNR